MKNFIYILTITFFCINVLTTQVPVPAPAQSGPILLLGGTAHVGNGSVIQNSAIGIENGKITSIGSASAIQLDQSRYTVINIEGDHVYPGLILPNSQLGLVEVSAVRAMQDQSEAGDINPNVRSLIAYNTDSEMPPTMRFNGILLAEVAPVGGRISGCSSVMEMEGWNWEDAAHTVDVAMHLNWPSKNRRRFDFSTFSVSESPNPDYSKEIAELETHFNDAKSYAESSDGGSNLKLEAMQKLFDGSLLLIIHTNDAKEIIESVNFASEMGVERIALVVDQEAIYVADFLKARNIPVILPPVHSLPDRADYDIVLPYKLPHLLTKAGVKVSLSHSGMLANARNLPFYAGTAVAHGMTKEEALRTITLNTAQMLGISDRVGSLEVGKDATLFVSAGDALDIRTNKLSHAFIRGKEVVLDNKQQELYRRFSKKYGHVK